MNNDKTPVSRKERIDPNELAALLDGAATPAERDKTLRELARSDESYADFVEAAAIVQALDEEANTNEPAAAPPLHVIDGNKSRSLPNTRSRTWKLVAAVTSLAAVLAFALLKNPISNSASMQSIAGLTRGLPHGAGSMQRSFQAGELSPSTVRGGSGLRSGWIAAFQLGTLVIDQQVAAQLEDTSALARISSATVTAIENTDVPSSVRLQLQQLTSAGPSNARVPLEQIANAIRGGGIDSSWFDLGKWNEEIRLAAHSGNFDFFATKQSKMPRTVGDLLKGETNTTVQSTAAEAISAQIRRLAQYVTESQPQLQNIRALSDSIAADIFR